MPRQPVRRSRAAARALLLTGEPDPRVLQTAFALFVCLDVGLRTAAGASWSADSWQAAGVALTLVLLPVALVVPWSRVPGWTVALVPLLDLLALGLVRLDPEGSAAGILVVVPALWLGRRYGRTGAVVAVVGVTLLAVTPAMLDTGVSALEVSRGLLIVVVAGWTGLAIALGLERLGAEKEEAERRGVELRRALDLIEHQRRFSDAILDTVDVGLVLLDRDGGYASFNRRHEDFMRLAFPDGHAGTAGQLGSVYGEDGSTLLVREQMPSHRAAQGEEYDDERIWVGADPRTRRALSVSARSVHDARGEFTGAALAYKDVTDFMRALQVKGEFVASVSHELRTPLTSVLGYLQLLQEREDLPDDVHDHLRVMQRNTDRLQRLVGDLLHTAQIEGGRITLVRASTDLAALVRESLAAAQPAAEAAGLTVVAHVPDELVALVDGQRMAQVVDNLVSNAIKYTPRGGHVVTRLRVDGTRVELAVGDTGIGISPSDRELLFGRFFRAREAERRSIQGVGLGLSIAKAIVEAHGGRIQVDSEVGRGSIFRVRLPRDVDTSESAAS